RSRRSPAEANSRGHCRALLSRGTCRAEDHSRCEPRASQAARTRIKWNVVGGFGGRKWAPGPGHLRRGRTQRHTVEISALSPTPARGDVVHGFQLVAGVQLIEHRFNDVNIR